MKSEILLIIKYFLIWRAVTLLFILIAVTFFASGEHYLGGTRELYFSNPYLWSNSNFDGTHYMRIARYGYEPLTHFFFPLYPFLIHLYSKYIIGFKDLYTLQISSILISNIFTFFSIWGSYRLFRLDLDKKKTNFAILCLLFFPTSIYLGATYTESLFLATTVWSFYFFRKEKYILAGLIGGFSSATRIFGANLLLAFSSEFDFKKSDLKKILAGTLSLSGLIAYMFFLYKTEGNPLMFNTNGNNFGEYRSANIVILPQVFYRYIFKILPNLNYSYFLGTFPPLMELLSASGLLVASIYGFFKLRKSYYIYLIAGFVMPTLYNSFVSLPRYAIVLFPIYILLSDIISNKYIKVLYLLISTILMMIVSIMFTRGLWIA